MTEMPRIWWSPWLGRFLRQPRSAWSIGYLEVETGHYREQLPDDAVELTVAAGDGAAHIRRVAEALIDVLPQVYGYRFGDEPANLDGALGRDAEKIAARLRSAGDGAAGEELCEPAQCGVPTGPGELCGEPVADYGDQCGFHIQSALRVALEEARDEVARLRSAREGAADVERRAWSAKPGEPICNRMYSGEYWVAKTCIKVLGHDGGHADWYGRTWNQDERDGAEADR